MQLTTRTRFGLAAGFVVLGAVASLLAAPELPAELVTSWDGTGEPNDTLPKTTALVFVPALSAAMIGLFAILPRIDPLGENVESFRRYYDWFVVVLSAYLFGVHAGIIAFNLGYEFEFILLVLAGVAALLYYTGILLGHAERNWFVGIRTPWTLSSDEVWERTHDLGGKLFKLSAVVTLAGLALGDAAIYVLTGAVLFTSATTLVYSYYCYRQLDDSSDVAAGMS
ncbi:SdpI family protein [Halovenus sp. HT40]|uniref:SdpI family protein n=1 Tax=Halovenus sp. HT40 TaxID=3126691 RepID=UPI00300F02ED